jgi:A118 family predicted phage portal protein
MPLPANGTAWPPKQLEPMRSKWTEWAAWYSNDLDQLASVYTGKTRPASVGIVRTAVRAVTRFFWGQSNADLTAAPERKLHVPIASDLCQASSDLLFAEAPIVAVEHEAQVSEDGKAIAPPTNVQTTMDRLELITGPDFHKALADGAETAAALGGVYLRATWDTSIATHPFVTTVDYDAAYPEFRWGRLVAVTFWNVVKTDGHMVWRHLERHETDAEGVGVIFHGLYQGATDNLGRAVPLADHASTEGLPVDAHSKISTLTEGLDVFHWENIGPNRLWRNDPLGKSFGRSDLDGIEPLLDALDEAYTSLMRDIRLGKAMLIVPDSMLTNNGPGGGASFNQNEIYSGVNAAPGSVADSKLAIEKVQFDIRVADHEQTISLLWNQIIRSAGYSAQTFGEGGEVAVTATEVFAKERRSGLSQGRKGRTVRPTLIALVRKLLAIDKAIFTSGADDTLRINVEIADGIKDDPEALARTAQMLWTAQTASIDTRVRLVNPGKDESWIKAEVERIKTENGIGQVADPDDVGADGENLGLQFQ